MKSKETNLQVAIAKDVICQLKAKNYKATPGTYCEISFKNPISPDSELQTELPQAKKCEVCALGSMFLSLIRLKDDLKVNEGYHDGSTWSAGLSLRYRLKDVFDLKQLYLIEDAFESESASFNKANAFGHQFKNPTDRMIAIMRNIIRNKGQFIPRWPKGYGKSSKS